MACRAVESWTLTSLVGAYLDLTLAYLLLVGATIAFFASKLLSLFGLSLPCTCDGRFGHPFCAQTSLLLDFPSANLASVHRSLRSRFPFDSLVSAGDSPSPRCRYAVQCPTEDCDLPPPPPDPAELPLDHRTPVVLISDLEKSCSASAERISGGHWDSDEEALEEDVADDEKKDSCNGVGVLLECVERVGLETMRSLERELEEERGARAALYLDLEKERSAAASAADEAMAMILRLQKEKAEIEMESRQYQRMVEEKSVYDDEEMEILKEIIVRREREKHVLEKEVEMYKQMVNSGETQTFESEFDTDENFLEDKLDTLADSSDDPILMLQQIYKSVGKKKEQNDFGLFNSADDCDQEFQEKTVLTTHRSVDDSVLYYLNVPFESKSHKDISDLSVKDEGEGSTPFEAVVSVSKIESDDTDQRWSESSQLGTELNILDVHVIDDGQLLPFEEDGSQNIVASEEDSSCTNFEEMELNIRRSCSEITNKISLIDSLSERAQCSNARSLSPFVDSERSKIENEVEVLRKRLEIIRQGREKLSLHADPKEKETFQLQLLDEIAIQLKEMKKVTKSAKSLRRVSLPALSSKFKKFEAA